MSRQRSLLIEDEPEPPRVWGTILPHRVYAPSHGLQAAPGAGLRVWLKERRENFSTVVGPDGIMQFIPNHAFQADKRKRATLNEDA